MRVAWLAMLLLTGPAWAQEPEVEPTVEAGPTLPERPTDAEREESLKPIQQALAANPTSALPLAQALIGDATKPQLHADAWALTGAALDAAGYPHAAVEAWAKSLSIDPRALDQRIDVVIDRAESTGLTRILEAGLFASTAKDPRVALHAARHGLRTDDRAAALARLATIDKGSKHFPEAKLLEGVIRSQDRDHQGALAALATAQARGTDPSDRWQRTLDVNLARTYFALGNQPKALVHYARIDREAPGWLHVHFETAWAHFRMGDMSGTLGALHSIRSPFFADGYWAEAELLEAYALFYMCKFPSARERIESFEAKWKPVRAKLDGIARVSAEQAWQDFERVAAGEPAATLPIQVLDRYSWDVRTGDTLTTVQAIRDERSTLVAEGLSAVSTRLATLERELTEAEGERILTTARAIRSELNEMLQDIEITKLDLLDLEKRLYQSASVTGDLGMGNPLGDIRELRRKRGHQVWPFQGEYWADEVGYYRVTARPECPVDLQIGGR
ncbi:MAG: hypothetical protein KC912_14475 [Proteobacteria bacterium]|nr:hypothetical protein [Pseudomonadota bacterium]